PGALMPPFVAQPFLEGPKMHFGIAPAEPLNVRIETGMIEPVEHLVILFPKDEADNRKRQSPKLHLFAKHAAKDLCRLQIGELTPGDFERLPYKLLGTLEDECDERPDVIGGNRLIRFIGTDGIYELTPEKPELDLIDVVVLHECNGPEDRRRKI